jgi:hypothetical protein
MELGTSPLMSGCPSVVGALCFSPYRRASIQSWQGLKPSYLRRYGTTKSRALIQSPTQVSSHESLANRSEALKDEFSRTL